MAKEEILQRIEKSGVVPVIRAKSATEALNIVENAYEKGLDVFEITMTIPDAFGVMKTVAEKYDDKVLIGAGTVLDVKAAGESLKAGAKFIVTPCLIKSVIEFCNQQKALICAGALTPTEVFEAWQAGADVVKIFPISAVGGSSYVKSLKAPFPDIRLMPTGGLKAENLKEFREAGAVAIGVGFKS